MHQTCHHCNYELMGLPDKGTCPECGQAYDKHSVYRAVYAKESAWTRHLTWITLAAITLMVLICGGLLSIKATNTVGAAVVTFMIASVSGFGAFTYWWAQRQERREAD